MLDSRIIRTVTGGRLRIGNAVKEPCNPLLSEDMPWEVRFDNLYPNVVYDADAAVWRLWYNPFIIDEVVSNTPPEDRKGITYQPGTREMGVCYAWSHDGITWHRPALGIFEFDGTGANNLVMRDTHGVGVYYDEADTDAARRYKAMHHTGVAWSPDGLRWISRECPEMDAIGDTHNNCIWCPERNVYVGMTRTWEGGQRIVARTESRDFRTWMKAEKVMEALPEERHRQTYSMPVFRYAGVYLGLVSLLNTEDDTVDCELAWSPDTVTWERVCPGQPLIPRGEPGAFDWGCIYAAVSPVNDSEAMRLYYCGSDDTHGSWRGAALGLARLPVDGFAGIAPPDPTRPAVIETTSVLCTGKHLTVSAGAAGGRVRAEVVGHPELSLDASTGLSENTSDGTITWRGINLENLKGEKVTLRFELDSATIYAFGFRE